MPKNKIENKCSPISDDCTCDFCITYTKYKWAVILECRCVCHYIDGIMGHDGLCCEFPNGKQSDSPFTFLENPIVYRDILDKKIAQE